MSKCKFKSTIKKRIRISTDRNEKGMILIAALALISILALMATLSVTTTYTNIKISSNYKTSVQSSYAVEAGYEEARARLRGSPSDPNYAGDTAINDPLWVAYILTSDTWQTSDDPNFDDVNYTIYYPKKNDPANQTLEINTIQTAPYISYWVKIRHKREYDAEQDGHGTSTPHYYDYDGSTAIHTAVDPGNIIYYGYATTTATTAVPFTSDDDPYNASPVDIITSYGNSGTSSSIIGVQTRKFPGPPILAAVYGDQEVHLHGDDVNITGDDVCASADSVPAVAYVNEVKLHDTYTLTSDAGATTQITALDLAVIIDELESIATVILTGDQENYNVGSESNYEVVYCDATQFGDNELDLDGTTTGYGILVVRGKIEFEDNVNWNGLIIASGDIEIKDDAIGVIYGAILSANEVKLRGTVDVYYSSCELDNAKSNFRHPTSKWKVGG
ncbi:MAG: pilus assembly PilX N-terminal domain-containing protein [Candidatus Scalindua sediminis]|nr:pilus assembly PilX N-terminal domain-containing protein [Candidatus Scalindua sediminis]